MIKYHKLAKNLNGYFAIILSSKSDCTSIAAMGLVRLQSGSLILYRSVETVVNKPRISDQFSWWFQGKAALGTGAPSHCPKVPLGFS